MKNVLYVVSNLRRSGPTNQLFSVIKYIDKNDFKVHVVTLSPEDTNTRALDFKNMGVSVHPINLSRTEGLFKAKKRIKEMLAQIKPDIIHSQGIRADVIMSKISTNIPWVLTSHNYPNVDYPMKFGNILGKLMALRHFSAMKKCQNVISCSKTISKQMEKDGVVSFPIQNGTEREKLKSKEVLIPTNLARPYFIVVGSLIKRKNNKEIVSAFNSYSKSHKGTLVILGDGPEKEQLEKNGNQKTYFLGNVPNVMDYLDVSDFFVSASLAEGLPMTVIESMAAGVPAFLSDIPSHKEVYNECKSAISIFKNGTGELVNKFIQATTIFNEDSKVEAKKISNTIFSAKRMSEDYQSFYKNIKMQANS